MREELQRLWIIPGAGFEDKGLVNGEAKFYDFKIGARDHGELLKNFCEEYKLDAGFCSSHTDYGKFFTTNGMILLINIGLIDGKRGAALYLPANMTLEQLNFLDERKSLFTEHFHKDISFFDIGVLPEGDLLYKTPDGFRNLRIESIIERKPSNDGQELLFKEVQKQRATLKKNKEY